MIENVQEQATKIVDGLANLDYSARLQKLDLPTLHFRRMRGDMIEIFKHIYIYDQDIIPPKFKLRNRPSRQHDFQLVQNRPRDGVRGNQTNSFYYRTTNVWNNLPRHVVSANNLNSFKNELDKAWNNHPLKYNKASQTDS